MKKCDVFINLGIICLLWFSFAFACKNSEPSRSPKNDGTPIRRTGQNTGGGAITREEVKAYLQKQLENMASDYKNRVVTIERFQQYASVQYGESPEMIAYPVSLDYTRSYEDFNSRRIIHRKNEYSRFARNVDNGDWEIIGGSNGEETIEDIPLK